MADTEKKLVLDVQAGEGIKTVNELKESIKELKNRLGELPIAGEEYNKTLHDLTAQQNLLSGAMKSGGADIGTLRQNAEGLGETYNAIARRMADLRNEWKNVDQSTEEGQARFAAIGVEINKLNDRLKTMDASIGNHQRNVGNYQSALDGLSGKLEGMPGVAGQASKALKGLDVAMKAMIANPVVAVMAGIAAVLVTVIKALKSSEQNMQAMKEAFAAFQPIGDLVTKALQGLGKVLGAVVGGFAKLTSAILGSNEASEERIRLAKEETAILKEERQVTRDNADSELKIAKLRNEAADKVNRTAEERIALLREAAEEEEKIAERAYRLAKAEYDHKVALDALTESSTDDLNEEADLYAKMVQAQTAMYQKQRELTSQLSEARKQAQSEAQAQAEKTRKAREDAIKAEQEAEEKAAEAESSLLAMRVANAEKGSEEELALRIEQYARERDEAKRKAQEDIRDEKVRNDTLAELDRTYDRQVRELRDARDAEAKRQADEEAQAQAEARQREAEAEAQALQAEWERDQLAHENRLAMLDENSTAYLKEAVELARYQADTLMQMEGESDEAFYARKIEAEKKYLEAKKKLSKKEVAIAQGSASAVSGLLSSLADVYESDENASRSRLRRAKAMKIASSIIETISGAVSAYMNSVETYGMPWGIPIGIANAATVTAAGMANVNKIKSQSIEGDSSSASTASAGASVSAPAVTFPVATARNVTSESEEERLNRMADTSDRRVVLVMSDLEVKQGEQRVHIAESSF